MTIEEFTGYTNGIQEFYGTELNQKEFEIWFKELGNLSIERFNYILETLYRKNKFMPKLSELIEINKQLPRELKPEPKKQKCIKCGGSGYLTYTKEINGLKYQYACVCNCGRQKRYDGMQIEDEKNKNKSYIPTENELGFLINTNHEIDPKRIIKAMNMLNHTNIVNDEIKEILRKKYIELTRK